MTKYNVIKLIIIIHLCIFTTADAQILYTSSGRSLKGNIKRLTERLYTSGHLVKTVYSWDTTTKTITGRIYDEYDIQKGKRIFKYNNAGRIYERYFYCNEDGLYEKEISKYDTHGYILEHHTYRYYYGAQSEPSNCRKLIEWLDGGTIYWETGIDSSIGIHIYKYDDKGNKIEDKYENITISEGNAHCSQIITYNTYYPDNKIASTKIINTYSCDGNADTTVKQTVYKYDASGNPIGENPFSLPTEEDRKVEKEYDTKGNVIKHMNKGSIDYTNEIEYY